MRIDPGFPFVWRVSRAAMGLHPDLCGRKGQRCRVLASGGRNSILVEFADGVQAITSRYFVREAKEATSGTLL